MGNFIGGQEANDKKLKKQTSSAINKSSPNANRKPKIEPNSDQTHKKKINSSKNQINNFQPKPSEKHNATSTKEEHNTQNQITQHKHSLIHNHSTSTSSQLVPLHIPFFKWEINVDTLVRLFIFA